MGGWEDSGGPRRVQVVPAVLLVLMVGGLVGSLVGRGSGGGLAIETVPGPDRPGLTIDPGDPPPDAEEVTRGAPPISIGEWRALSAAPVDVPVAHAGAWTGEELIVFGGDGPAAFDPRAREWAALPPPPRPLHAVAAPVWTGEELLVWSRDGVAGVRLGAGMAYRPATREWRRVAPPPGAPLDVGFAVWTGGEVVAVGTRGAVAYDPATDNWRGLADPQHAAVPWAGAVWTGREVLVWGVRRQGDRGPGGALPAFTEAYDPRRDRWRQLPPPVTRHAASAPAVWTGEEVVLWGRPVAGGGPPTGAALDPEVPRWRTFPPASGVRGSDATARIYGHSAVWTGEQVIFHGGYPRSVGLALDPSNGRWATLPRRPALVNHVAAWTGDAMLVWGGYGRRGPTAGLVEWQPVGPGRPPL